MIISRVKIKKPKIKHKNLSKDNVVGYAYQDSEHLIEIDPNQSDREYFLTLFHEMVHLLLPDLKENQVCRIENTSGAALWLCILRLRRKAKAKEKKSK